MTSSRNKTLKEIHSFVENGTQFGFLVLTGKYEFRLSKTKRPQYNCYVETLCVCGTKKYIRLHKVKSKDIKSCGCYRKQRMHDCRLGKRKHTNYKYFAPYFLKQVKKHCKRHGRIIDFDLTIQDLDSIYESQNGLCYYSNEKLILPDFTLGVRYPESDYNVSVDRINSKLGYNRDNCALCLKDINKMKLDFDIDYFVGLCTKISNTYKN